MAYVREDAIESVEPELDREGGGLLYNKYIQITNTIQKYIDTIQKYKYKIHPIARQDAIGSVEAELDREGGGLL